MRDTMHLFVTTGFIALVTACSPGGVSDQPSAPAETTLQPVRAEVSLEIAEKMYQKSEDLGFAWRATAELIEAAKASQQAGDMDTAQLHISRAIALAQASIAQAEQEAIDWQTRAPFGQ